LLLFKNLYIFKKKVLMKRLLLTLLFLPFIYVCALGQNKTLAVGTTTPNPNAALQVESPTNNQGLLVPRLTTAQRINMSTLAAADAGLIVYDTDLKSLHTWNGTVWKDAGVAQKLSIPYADTITNSAGPNLFSIVNTGTVVANVGVARFENTNVNSNFTTLFVRNAGTNSAGFFQMLTNTAPNAALRGITNSNVAGGHGVLGLTTGTGGSAGIFNINNAGNNAGAISASTNGTGQAGNFRITNPLSTNNALQTTTNGPGVAINAHNSGAGNGFAGFFLNSDPANTFPAVQGNTAGVGSVFRAFQTSGPGGGMDIFMFNATSSAPGLAVNARHLGVAGQFLTDNAANPSSVITANTNGTGDAIFSQINNATSTNAAVKGRSINIGGGAGAFEIFNSANARTAVYAETQGTGSAGDFNINNVASGSAALRGNTNGTGNAGVFTILNATNSSPALNVSTDGTGWAGNFIKYGTGNSSTIYSENFADGAAGDFRVNNLSSTSSALYVATNGIGRAIQANHTGASGDIAHFQSEGTNVARIDKTGRGFFNGGTQTGGADVAEMFDVEGNKSDYEPGDVLVISESTDRTIEKSSSSYSTKVAGVYATKPGVTLTEKDINESLDELVPMGVIGVIPTKVSLENGAIKRGDLLVTSSTKGYAMKAVSKNGDGIFPAGVIIGKALENFESASKGKIRVLVNIK